MKRPYFFWDYDVTEEDIRNILAGSDLDRKCWVVARILQYALWKDIWKYITVDTLATVLPYLKIRPKEKTLWGYALKRWQHGS